MKQVDVIHVSKDRPEKGKYVKPLFRGLSFIFKNFLSKPVTLQYPTEKTQRSQRWRGLHRLEVDEKGELKCVACGLCARTCPSEAITIVPYEEEGETRYPRKFVIDELRCIFCGFCQEACPEGAITLTEVYDYIDYNRTDFIFDIEKLKAPEKLYFKGK